MESQFTNSYVGLMMSIYGFPASTALTTVKQGKVPPMKVTQALNYCNGTTAITTPPPHIFNKVELSTPTPRGKSHICFVGLADLMQRELVVNDASIPNEKEKYSIAVRNDAES